MVDLPAVDKFKEYYYLLKDKAQEDIDVMERELTQEFRQYMMQKIQSKMLVNIAIVGEPGIGKSTVALEIMRQCNTLLEQYFKKKISNYDMIASDDTEFIRMVKDADKRRQVCMTVDEYNPMGRTGANATTEIAEADFFSNLCRVYYVHRIKCAPNKVTDPNVELILEVMSKDEEKKRTHCKIMYRHLRERTQLDLGVIWIDVTKTIESDWYRKYEEKKQMRVDLLNQHAIRDVRELEEADIAKEVIDDLLPKLAFLKKGDLAGLARLKVVTLMKKKYKTILSWFAEDELLKPVRIILDAKLTIDGIKDKSTKEALYEELRDAYGELNRKVNILRSYRGIK